MALVVYAFSSSSLSYSAMHVLFVRKVCEVRCVRFLCGFFCDGVFWFARKCGWCGGDGGGGEGDEGCRWVLGEFVEEGGVLG